MSDNTRRRVILNMDDLYGNQLFLGLTLLQLILGTAAVLSGLYLVIFYVGKRDEELRRHWRILASALNAFTIGLGLTCFMFALSTIVYELTTTINHPPLEAWVCPVYTDSLPLSHSTSSQSNLLVL